VIPVAEITKKSIMLYKALAIYRLQGVLPGTPVIYQPVKERNNGGKSDGFI
jgi:hypothetical protein